jgi:hypothetical protein
MGGYIGATGQDEVQEQFDILKDEIDANASYINTLVGIPDPTHLPFFGVNILNPGLYGLVERAEVNIKALQTQQGTSSTAISGIETSITGIEASITGIGGQITAVESSISTIQFVELPVLSASIVTAAGVAADALVKANRSLDIWEESGNNVYHKKSGNVGIGITYDGLLTNKLEVNGNINIPLSSNYKIGNQPLNYSHLAGTPPVSSKWTNATDTSTNIFYNTGNVGIGTISGINNKLEVGGNINIPLSSNYKINNQPLNYSHLAGTLSYNSLTDKLTQGTNITITGNVINNTYSLPTAGVGTGGTLGGVKVDGTTITITNQVISAVAGAQQLNSDWTQTNASLKSFILNKPTAGANISFANNQISLTDFVGIGTTPHATYKLNVNGTINSTDLLVSSSVGIGTITPTTGYKLDVRGSILSNGNFATTGTGFVFAGGNSSSISRTLAAFSFYGLDDIIFRGYNKLHLVSGLHSDTIPPAITISTTNNVGIATTTPTTGYKLDVRGSILSDNIIATSGAGFLFAGTTLSGLTRETIATVPIGFFELNDIILRGNNKIHLQSGNSTTIPPAITISTTNKVGIGATNPNCSLQLHNPATAQDVRIQFTDGTSTSAVDRGIHIRKGTDGVGYMWNFENKDLVFGTNNNERFKIGFDGIVGLGTTTAGVLKIGVATLGAFTAMTKLQVYASDNDGIVAIFKHPNDTQGIGVRYDGLSALGNNPNQNIIMRPRGTGTFSVEYGGVSKFSVNSAGGLTISPDTIAITSGGGGRTYYINNGPSLYWGYGTGDTHQFRNSANTNLFTINNEGVLTMKENVWHKDIVGYNRFYFGNNSTTYISGHGTDSCVEFRQNTNSMTARITNIGQWACHFRTIANSNTDDIGVNSNTSLDAVGYYFAHIIYNTFTGFHRCYYADDEIFNNDSSKEETDIFKNNYKGRIVISTGKIKTDLSRPVPKVGVSSPNDELKGGEEEPNINLAEPNNNLEEPNIDYTKPINCEQIDKENPNMEWYTAIDKDGITIEEAIPIVQLCRVKKDKRVYGVLGSPNRANNNKNRLIVNSLGEGAICVCNSNGNIENGDYIQSSDILGYGEKQDDDLLHNYSVAKAVMDCNFELDSPYYQCYELEGGVRVAFIACTYHCG